MVKRRRTSRKQSSQRNSPKQNYSRPKKGRLKDRFQTSAIWGLILINIVLIVSLISNFFASPNDTPVSSNLLSEKAPEQVEIITVEVLNACGVQGLANEITQYLRNQNFDVVNVGNYEGGYLEQTLVLDRVSSDNVYAKKVAKVVGVPSNQIASKPDDSLQLMVSVIIGNDYKKLKVYEALQ